MKRKLVYIPIIIIITGLILTFSIIINNSIILTRIYYKINYKGNIHNLESLIEKSELFEYQKYCLCRDSWGVYNLSDVGYYYHIDREFIDFLKVNIDEDKERFYVYPFFHHHFSYSLEVSNQSLVYLTYNNNSIIKAEYQNYTDIFASQMGLGNWYLNFTQIPFAPNMSSTIILNDIFLVKMNLNYSHDYGLGGSEGLSIEQYLGFNSKLQNMFVYFPITPINVA